MGLEDFDINFEKESDQKDISIEDDMRNGNNFKINTHNIHKKHHKSIAPKLTKLFNTRKEIRKPSLSNKSIPMGDLDMLVNSKKSNMSSDDDSGSESSKQDDYPRQQLDDDDDGDEVSQMFNTSEVEDDDNEFTSGNIDEGAGDIDSDEDISQSNDRSYNEEPDDREEEEEEEEELSYEQIQKSKAEFIYKLNRLDKLGYKSSRRYSMASNLEDLKFEYNTLNRQRSIEKSVKFSRKMLMAFVSGAEYLNHRFDYAGLKLDKWSEHTMESIGDYDEVFEELHDKYNDSVQMAPELRLLMMVGGSAFMFHMTQSLFKTTSPEIGDILRQNPDIMKSVSQAAANSMAGNIAREENDAGSESMLNMMMGGTGVKSQNSMGSPSGVDDILEELGKNTQRPSQESNYIPTKNIEFLSKKKKNAKRGGIQIDI